MSANLNESALRKSLVYSSTATVADLTADLNTIRTIDSEAEKNSSFWSLIIGAAVVAIIVGIVCLAQEYVPAAIVIGGAGAVLLVVSVTKRSIHARMDLDNRRYELVAELLKYVSRDMAPDALVSVSINFQPHNHRSKFERSGTVGHWNAKFYVDPWLTMSARFLDGTKFSVTMIEKHQDRNRTKRSASGKTKYKYKTKSSSEAIVSLRIKPTRYPDVATLQETFDLRTMQWPAGVAVKAFSADNESLSLRTTSALDWNVFPIHQRDDNHDAVKWIAMKLMCLYGLLNSAKAGKS